MIDLPKEIAEEVVLTLEELLNLVSGLDVWPILTREEQKIVQDAEVVMGMLEMLGELEAGQ
ncbi:MAG: hypothetical protein KKD77_21225 [Gammaproteobacteria bacterium]|nr:hypothetical protein [Gammaproteobacteria bacterium]